MKKGRALAFLCLFGLRLRDEDGSNKPTQATVRGLSI